MLTGYVNREFEEYFNNLGIQTSMHTQTKVRCKRDVSLLVCLKMAVPLSAYHSLSFTDLYSKSGISHKPSYLKYLKFLKTIGMIHQEAAGSHYSITQRGRDFVNLFRMEVVISHE